VLPEPAFERPVRASEKARHGAQFAGLLGPLGNPDPQPSVGLDAVAARRERVELERQARCGDAAVGAGERLGGGEPKAPGTLGWMMAPQTLKGWSKGTALALKIWPRVAWSLPETHSKCIPSPFPPGFSER